MNSFYNPIINVSNANLLLEDSSIHIIRVELRFRDIFKISSHGRLSTDKTYTVDIDQEEFEDLEAFLLGLKKNCGTIAILNYHGDNLHKRNIARISIGQSAQGNNYPYSMP